MGFKSILSLNLLQIPKFETLQLNLYDDSKIKYL